MNKMKPRNLFVLALVASAVTASTCPAATIANWQVLSALSGTASSTSGLSTDSPVFGDGSAGDMDGVGVAGLFGTTASPASVTLNVGETLTVTANVTLTGGLSTGAGAAYRFAVQHDDGQFDVSSADNWGGGWNHILITGTTTGDGFYKARTDGHFMSSSSNASLVSGTPTTSGTFDGDSASTYLWTMSITRDTATTVDLLSSFVGGDGNFSESYTLNDVNTTLFTYNAVGMQTTGASDLDRLSVSNAQYTVVPEPTPALLGILGVGALVLLRQRNR